jgi:hypothetical protein
MAYLQNNAEGGTVGAVVTTGNSGGASGNAFTVATANNITYVSDAAHGFIGYQINGNSSTVGWAALGGVMSLTSRFYLRLLATPTASGLIETVYTNNSTAHAGRLLVSTGRGIQMQNTAGATSQLTPSYPMPLNTWHRVEVQRIIGTTTSNGTFNVQVFVGDSTTVMASYTNTAANTGLVAMTGQQWGRVSGTGWGSGPQIDDIASRDGTTAIGPWVSPWSVYTGTTTVPLTLLGTWNGTQLVPTSAINT